MLPRRPRWTNVFALCALCALWACAKKAPQGTAAPGSYADAEYGAQAEPAPKGDAAAETWKRSTLTALTSRLRIGDDTDLPLASTEIRARVDGFRARVMVDFVFDNPHTQQLEGDFQLRLPEGASPYFLAFGQTVAVADAAPLQIASDGSSFSPDGAMAARATVWEQPRRAVMAEKEVAAVAYRNTVRRRVDPALAEWAGAGVFNARIFPIEPGATHRVVVGFDVDLTPIDDDLELALPVPPQGGDVSIELDVAELAGGIEVSPALEAQRDAGRAYYRFDQPADDRVTLRLRDAGPILLSGTDAATGPYFATRFAPELPARPSGATKRTAVFALDTSLSSNPERFEIWRRMMKAILENDADIERFAVMTFSVGTQWWREELVPNTAANREAMMRFTDGLALEGATDVGAALAEAGHPDWLREQLDYDTFLLSDGAATWGEDDALAVAARWRKSSPGAVFAYNTGIEGGAPEFLAALTRDTGGALFSVVGDSEVAAASVAHRARPWTIDAVSIDGGRDLIVEGRPRALFPGQRLTLVGRGQPEDATVRLELSQGSEKRTVLASLTESVRSDLAPRRYGQVAVRQLEDLDTVTHDRAVSYARHFRVTGRTCSLVMLETDEDYAAAGIGEHDDATLVQRRLASQEVVDALRQLGKRLGNPKDRILAELERLATMPGIEAAPPAAVLAEIEALPDSAFDVRPEPLHCRRTEQDVPAALASQLRRHEPEYATVVDEANRLHTKKDRDCALQVLSSMVEGSPGDAVLARDVAFTAAAWGLHGQAAQLLQRVAHARPYEPITYHALGNTLADAGNPELASVFFEVALAGQWDPRFGDFRRIVALDYLRVLGQHQGNVGGTRRTALRRELGIDAADLVVTIMWNTDATDVDLHIHEPLGGHVFYSNPEAGGRLTTDVTQGYGPEMYVAERAQRGRYRLTAHYFASDQNRMGARTKVYATIIRGFGTPQETIERKVVTLAEGKDVHEIAQVRVQRR